MVETIVAVIPALLPRRYWQSIDLPVQQMAVASAILTILAGMGLGIPGYVAYSQQVLDSSGLEFMPPPMMILTGLSFALFSPLGLFSNYLVVSGFLRALSVWVDEPFGDPILSGIDRLVRYIYSTVTGTAARRAREASEGSDEPDRLHVGAWAGLTDVDYVIVAARRKPGWQQGTFVITPDGWFTLGAPFDRPTPNGLRTVYPLTAQKDNAVLRKGVSYNLPPLRRGRGE